MDKNFINSNEIPKEKTIESSILDGFLNLLRKKNIPVSTPEWLQFLVIVNKTTKIYSLEKLLKSNELLNKIRLFAQTTLIKNKADETAFSEAFNEYFGLIAKKYIKAIEAINIQEDVKEKKATEEAVEDETIEEEIDTENEPDIKQELGIDDVEESLDIEESKEHDDKESVHGGKKDQHNDILQKKDLSKKGGGEKKEESIDNPKEKSENPNTPKKNSETKDDNTEKENSANTQEELTEDGLLIGGGKGKSIIAERIQEQIIHNGEQLTDQTIEERETKIAKMDRRTRYEVRPDKTSMREVIRNIRRIILDVSEIKSKNINIKKTVSNFSRNNFRFDYIEEKEKQPEIVLFIDVGGPVDAWSPIVKEVSEAMVKGLTKLEIYLFHNNLYGYVWKPDQKNLLASSYAKPNSLIDIKTIVKKRKKIIIYGDAEMSYSEFSHDGWPPSENEDRVEKFSMSGQECLNFINKKSNSAVWINPVFKKEWQNRDYSGTIRAANEIISMHDLTIGGVEDAIRDLMKNN